MKELENKILDIIKNKDIPLTVSEISSNLNEYPKTDIINALTKKFNINKNLYLKKLQ